MMSLMTGTRSQKKLSGGDYLTFERHKQAQSSNRKGRTPSKRLEGLISKMEEFHNQGEVLKVLCQFCHSYFVQLPDFKSM